MRIFRETFHIPGEWITQCNAVGWWDKLIRIRMNRVLLRTARIDYPIQSRWFVVRLEVEAGHWNSLQSVYGSPILTHYGFGRTSKLVGRGAYAIAVDYADGNHVGAIRNRCRIPLPGKRRPGHETAGYLTVNQILHHDAAICRGVCNLVTIIEPR